MNTPKIRLALLGIAFGILLALLLAPQTRWLVRLQALTVLHQYRPIGCDSYSRLPANDARAYDTVAARHPSDFAIQYARATHSGNVPPLANLRMLTRRFPNRPMLYANILREASHRPFLSSADASELSGDSTPTTVMSAASPQEIAAYNKDAAAGERVDPDNAYFPLMLAYGLFAVHRNAAALAAVERASGKPIWNEYLAENVDAKWRLHTEAFDDPGAMPRAAISSSEMLPEYQRLRQVARIVVYQAVLKEQAGHLEEGYKLREAVRRCGNVMRVQSATFFIGSLVGVSISAIAQSRPGGAPAPKNDTPDPRPPEQIAQQRLDAYCVYVTKIGHPEATQRARDEEAARRSVQGLIKDDPQMLKYVTPLWHLVFWWMTGVALLLNIAWVLALGLLAAGRARLTFAPTPPIGWKAVLAHCLLAVGGWLVLALLFVCVSGLWVTLVYHAPIDWQMTVGVGGAFGLIAWGVGRGLRRLPRSQRIAVLKIAFLLPVLIGVIYGLYWLAQWVAWPLAEILRGLGMLYGGGWDMPEDLRPETLRISMAATLIVPLLLAIVLGITALVKRLPLLGTLTTGFQRLTIPAACVLIIVYGGVLIGTSRQERRVTALNRQIVFEDGRFFAAQAGQPWPGAVR